MFGTKFAIKLCVLFVAGAITVIALSNSISQAATAKTPEEKFNSIVTKNAAGKYTLRDGANVGSITITPEHSVIVEMHEMANNYIIADEIRGKREITQERLNSLIIELLSVEKPEDYPHSKDLLDILTGWKDGRFSALAYDHNYLWDALGGQIGRAKGVKGRIELPAWAIDN